MNINKFIQAMNREFKKRGWTVFINKLNNQILFTRNYRTSEVKGFIFKKKVWVTKNRTTITWNDWAENIKTKEDLKLIKDVIISRLKGIK